MKSLHLGLVALGVCLAAGLTLGGYFVGQTLYNGKVAVNTTAVKGLAERRVKSDLASWTLGFKVSSSEKKDVPQLYKRLEMIQDAIIKLLKKNGFKDSEIKTDVIDYKHKVYRDKSLVVKDQSFILSGEITVTSMDIKKIEPARKKLNVLISRGINVINYNPVYKFTKLNEIKPDMLREAAKNARVAANEFAKNAGVKVGSIRSARQGAFTVRDAGEEYGDRRKIEKDVRVVTNITFYLTD